MQQQMLIEPDFAAIAPARRWASNHLKDAGVAGQTLDILVLLVSEVVTNAVAHAIPPVALLLAVDAQHVRVEVRDCAREVPIVKYPTASATGGRGIALVDMLATRWGVTSFDDDEDRLKSVWFEVEF